MPNDRAISGEAHHPDGQSLSWRSSPRDLKRFELTVADLFSAMALANKITDPATKTPLENGFTAGYVVTINVREGDTWKIRMLYWSYK